MIVQFEAGLEAEGDIARPLRGALAMTSQLFVAVRQQREQSLHAIRAIPPVAPGIELRRFDLGNRIAVSIFIHRLGLRRQEPIRRASTRRPIPQRADDPESIVGASASVDVRQATRAEDNKQPEHFRPVAPAQDIFWKTRPSSGR